MSDFEVYMIEENIKIFGERKDYLCKETLHCAPLGKKNLEVRGPKQID